MFKPALILALALAGPSAPQEAPAFRPDPTIVTLPPAEHQGPPDRPVLVLFGNPGAVNSVCGPAAPGHVILACTFPERRVQVMPDPCLFPHEFYARLACHENGHLPRRGRDGWVHLPVR